MSNPIKRCPHCKANAPRFFKDDGNVACFICHKNIYQSFKKFCPTCKRMVDYHDSAVLHGDTCGTCGDICTGMPVPYVIVDDEEGTQVFVDTEDVEAFHMLPAREIWKQQRGTSSWFIQALLEQYTEQWSTTESKEKKRQSWQYIKACVRCLKEMKSFFTWQDFEPGTEAWKQYWKEHPEEQEDMAAHTRYHNTKAEALTQRMLDQGESPEDVKEAIASGVY